MTETLLLEIGLEEVPAKYVRDSSEQLLERVQVFLEENRIVFAEAKAYATPRRLAVKVEGVAERQEDLLTKVKGPSKKIALQEDGSWSKAALGFARGQDVNPDTLYFEELNGVEYVYASKETQGEETFAALRGLAQVVTSMTFPVSMHWGSSTFKYIRPIHWLVALWGQEVIPFRVLDVETGRVSRGHRFLGREAVLARAEEYEEKLREQYVIVDQDAQKAMIRAQIHELEKEKGWHIPEDDALLEEVNALVEYPTAFYGDFDPKYLALPEEVLITSMKGHQRYFEVRDPSGKLLPYFISVRNGDRNHLDNVKRGNRKVLTARLEDAFFFWEEDQKLTIPACVAKLEGVSFHARIGSIAQKMQNTSWLAAELAALVGLSPEEQADLARASEIYKFDLVTNMVSEFPELQGIMGEKYALMKGEKVAVAAAIREHYLPLSSEGELPESQVGAALAVADKLDSIISFFKVGMFPTGSNDPYALRRQMMGVIQIAESFHWSFSLEELLYKALQDVYLVEEGTAVGLIREIGEFAKGRIQQKLGSYAIAYDVQEAILASHEDNLVKLMEQAQVLQLHHQEEDFKETIEALARVVNISKDVPAPFVVNTDLLQTDSEKNLYVQSNHLDTVWEKTDADEKYHALAALTPYITAYFEENMVMVENRDIRDNRLNTLGKLTQKILQFADVRKLVTK